MKCNDNFLDYKKFVDIEMQVKDEIITKQQAKPNQLMEDIRKMKTVLAVPRFRNIIATFELKDCSYEDLMLQIQEIIKS